MNIWNLYLTFKKINSSEDEINKIEITSESTYEEYKEWFKDDSLILNINQLSADLKPYAIRIKERIDEFKESNTCFHISLCGGFGSGKSSIIKCVVKELDSDFIYSNIDTWGTDTKSINAFVLAKVVEDVAQYVDMSAFKSLPKQYIEALKLGNNASKLLAIFSATLTDPLKDLIKLNDVLGAINKKLLITIQDVDRCLEPKKTTEELAALLDKLKDLKNISFVIALGYEGGISEIIKKVCDYREDLIQPDNYFIFLNFINELNQRAADKGFVISHAITNENDDVISNISKINRRLAVHKNDPYSFISSQRSFKHICRRIDAIWQKNKLMGEIDLECLCLLVVLREELPAVFGVLIKNQNILIEKIKSYIEAKKKQDKIAPEKNKEAILLEELSSFFPFAKANYAVNLEEIISYLDYLFKCGYGSINLGQSVALNQNTNECNDYFKRFSLEQVPSDELADQVILRLFKNIKKEGNIKELINNFQDDEKGNHWIKAYSRFSRAYFISQNNEVYKTIYTQMVEYYYQETVVHIHEGQRKVTRDYIKLFLSSLLYKCLEGEKNIKSLLENTLKLPLVFDEIWPNESSKKRKVLYDLLVEDIGVINNVFSCLSSVDSALIDLYEAFDLIVKCKSDTLIFANSSTGEQGFLRQNVLWKGIIVALLDDKTPQGCNQFKECFICYCLYQREKILEEVDIHYEEPISSYIRKFKIEELELIQEQIKQLDGIDLDKIYLGEEKENAENMCKNVLNKLDSILKNGTDA